MLAGPAGSYLYPRTVSENSHVEAATRLLRRILASESDGEVVIIQVGFSTNLARLLDTGPDEFSPLSGRELLARKVRLLSVMGGNFQDPNFAEYNIKMDIPLAKKLFSDWPGPIVVGGYEVGASILYDPTGLETDFRWAASHPLVDAYRFYRKMPYQEPLWDPASVLNAIRPGAGYFSLSEPGRVSVSDRGTTSFHPLPSGNHRYLIVNDRQRAAAGEAISTLMSQPPDSRWPVR